MRDLKPEEIGHVYGAGGVVCGPSGKPKGHTSKHGRSSHRHHTSHHRKSSHHKGTSKKYCR